LGKITLLIFIESTFSGISVYKHRLALRLMHHGYFTEFKTDAIYVSFWKKWIKWGQNIKRHACLYVSSLKILISF